MLRSKKQWEAIKLIASKFEMDFLQEFRPYWNSYTYEFLEILEGKLEALLAERGEEYFQELDERT